MQTQRISDMQRRTLLTFAPAALMAGCGYRLRGAPEFAFSTLFIVAPAGSALARELHRTLESSGGRLKVLRDAAALPTADAVLDLLSEQNERAVVGLTPSGQVRELQLRLRVRFRLRTPQGDELIPESEILQARDISYSETIALAKEAEENLLVRNMQTDIVQQLLRRLAAVKAR
jgi:LPS-assembly lipoprotein